MVFHLWEEPSIGLQQNNMNLELITQEVIKVSEEAALFIKKELYTFNDSKIEYKDSNNLVSYVDKTAEEILVKGLAEILPEAGFITEEGTADHNNEELKWVIDPLDGTTNFAHKLPVFSTSVGLIKGNKPILGVVIEVNRNDCFSAWKGGGAYLNGKKIQVSPHKTLEKTLLATGFPYYMFGKLDCYVDILKDLIQETQGLRRMGSAAVDLCYTACGIFDGYFEFNLNSYDIAGGAIILEEAGGIVTRFDGSDDYISGEEVLAASPAIHEAMKKIINKHWK